MHLEWVDRNLTITHHMPPNNNNDVCTAQDTSMWSCSACFISPGHQYQTQLIGEELK